MGQKDGIIKDQCAPTDTFSSPWRRNSTHASGLNGLLLLRPLHSQSLWSPWSVPQGELRKRNKLMLIFHMILYDMPTLPESGQQSTVSCFRISLKTVVRRNPFRRQNTVHGIWFRLRNGFQVRVCIYECALAHRLFTGSWTSTEYNSKLFKMSVKRSVGSLLRNGKNGEMFPSHVDPHQKVS